MSDLDPNILIEISTKLAGIDERTKALQQADINAQEQANHRHKNVMTAIETFVPRREIESMDRTTRAYAESLAAATKDHCDRNREAVISRVEKVEDGLGEIAENSRWLKRAIVGAIVTAAIGATGSLLAFLFHTAFVTKVAAVAGLV